MGVIPWSPYPHHAWFANWVSVTPPRIFSVHQRRGVTHRIVLTTEGDARIGIATGGAETTFHTEKGDLGFFPCDREVHRISIETTAVFRSFELLIPDQHIRPVRTADGTGPGSMFSPVPVFRDVVLRACVLRLSTMAIGQGVSEELGDEVAACQILARLSQRLDAGPPEWPNDTSVFTPLEVRDIVAFLTPP